ncbi:hypothetical protein MMIC_P1806 [Mariprofundus micogutta]|uniref:Antitoxin SocA-like Panacea domain-containing protein n=1 Tax=Mariprofundus micogutta TaxID=1921010 RepID=A0A1L8CPH9_9PROT|nr:Panacea domain-containing protein [Mariprofundus micogutta]GAV20831.1 hypothetical protein MMIC_P1806 [Mariprofundus micogutta]
MFSEHKVSQMAGYFLSLCEGNSMPHLKLMKLLYLADRKSLDEYGFPISGDSVVAMPHGPVLSMTLDFINGAAKSSSGGWESWISDRSNHRVSLRSSSHTRGDFDELSDIDIDILDEIWIQFKDMGRWDIRDYTHDNCPEWEDPKGSSMPIPFRKIFEALGKSRQEAVALEARIEDEVAIEGVFARL